MPSRLGRRIDEIRRSLIRRGVCNPNQCQRKTARTERTLRIESERQPAEAVPQPLNLMAENIETRTKLLYGVFATEKSLLIGYRKLVRRSHAQMVTNKALSGKTDLPQEIVDLVADRLCDLEDQTVEAAWNPSIPHRENLSKFRYVTIRTPAEHEVIERMQSMGVNALAVRASNPREADGSESRGTTCYAHLSAVKERPELKAQMTRFSVVEPETNDEGLWFSSLKHGGMRQTCDPEHLPQKRAIEHVRGTQFNYERGDHADGKPTSGEVTTLSRCFGMEEAIARWDAVALERFVKELDLDIVPFDPSERLKPGLFVWQFFSDR